MPSMMSPITEALLISESTTTTHACPTCGHVHDEILDEILVKIPIRLAIGEFHSLLRERSRVDWDNLRAANLADELRSRVRALEANPSEGDAPMRAFANALILGCEQYPASRLRLVIS